MCFAVLLSCMLSSSSATNPPSCGEIVKTIVANREKIRSLHVRTVSRRPLEGTEFRRNLYLDVGGQRWRTDVLNNDAARTAPSQKGDGYAKCMSVDIREGIVYEYYPSDTSVVARKISLQIGARERSVRPFPDPRNAGLVPRFFVGIGTPFESGGGRSAICSSFIDCTKYRRVSVTSAVWQDQPCWKVQAEGLSASN